MEITDERIEDAALNYAEQTIAVGDKDFLLEVGFTEGARWAMEQMSNKWISVKDKLPKDNTSHAVLINGDRNKSHKMFYTGGYDAIYSEWINPYGDKIEENVTHWMPLPEPPKV